VNFHSFTKELRTRFDEAVSLSSMSTGSIREDLKIENKLSDEPINTLAIYAGGLSITSAGTVALPPLSSIAVFAGLVSMLASSDWYVISSIPSSYPTFWRLCRFESSISGFQRKVVS
jgi:hypothetical protein